MEATMMMPAAYAVLDANEMTYTDGGATMVEALCAWVLPPYAWYKGVMAIRNYRKANPKTWMDTGLDALSRDMEKSTPNLLLDIAAAVTVVSTSLTGVGLVINAIVVLS